ncbi:NIPSNAP family protein [Grimontia kaedaensis]|uniref:NIPSNAP family protein n=1 Tax=Grimontia kaedaensis TaxID=2872157 RepID=A0ABY4WP08_9GAMM|nr:NIPSNAP family protein [Grimontia kaedaensis]USH01301.1 NIPSNAP family protein [Grimontia kaedaensis]
MFHRRKFYIVKSEFVDSFNELFNTINLPNQLKHGARLTGRWMKALESGDVEIFAIWEYDSKEAYEQIEAGVRADEAHSDRIEQWFAEHGGRKYISEELIVEMRNEQIFSTSEIGN